MKASHLESFTCNLKHSFYYQQKHQLKNTETEGRKPDFLFIFVVTPQKMCQCLRAHWKDHKATLQLGSELTSTNGKYPSFSTVLYLLFLLLLTADLDTSHTGPAIRVTRKRQSKQKIGHDAAVQIYSLYGSANIDSPSIHARDSRNPSGK